MRPDAAIDRRSAERFDRLAVAFVALVLACGLGMMGWLAGHVGTYDLLADGGGGGAGHAHVDHGAADHSHAPVQAVADVDGRHAYMERVRDVGVRVVLAGAVLASLLVLAASPSLVARLRTAMQSRVALAAAAALPPATFLLVEAVEGSIAARGASLLIVGLPVQSLLGVLVLCALRAVLTLVADVAERLLLLARPRPLAARVGCGVAVPVVPVLVLRRCPMAESAPRRGPPLRTP